MPDPVIIIDRSEIAEGRLEDLKAAMKELVEFVKANEPNIIAYNVYLNENSTQVTVLQVHPDSESAKFHMKIAGPAFSKFVDYIKMREMDIYGKPSHDLLERLQLKSRMLGGGSVGVHELHAGFARF